MQFYLNFVESDEIWTEIVKQYKIACFSFSMIV